MSFLRVAPSRILPLTRTRGFSTSPFVCRSVLEGTKDAIKAADRVAADAAVKAIEKEESIVQKVKEATTGAKSEAEGSANEVAGDAKGEASNVAGKVKGKASELTGEAKGTASDLTGKAKGKVEEVKGKM